LGKFGGEFGQGTQTYAGAAQVQKRMPEHALVPEMTLPLVHLMLPATVKH
jgi:hypothetical protein